MEETFSLEATDTPSGDTLSEFAIDTSEIYRQETYLFNDPEYRLWKKLSSQILQEFEHTIQLILLRNVKPTVNHNENQLEYLKQQFESRTRRLGDADPFYHNYFVVSYDTPLEKIKRPTLSFAPRNYYYLFSYDTSLVINRSMISEGKITSNDFDLLFALTLRECDIMKVNELLSYQLQKNFANSTEIFCKYLKQIVRKFRATLFTEEVDESIKEWMSEKEKNSETANRKKIKTVLTVDELAYLFKALLDSKLITHDNKNDVIACAVENFESKNQANISSGSFNSKFYSPSQKAIEFWIDQFDKLAKNAIRDMQKLST